MHKKKGVKTLAAHEKILYCVLLQAQLNPPETDKSEHQPRMDIPLWTLMVDAPTLQQSQTLFQRLCGLQPISLSNLSITLFALADYAPPTEAYPAIANILLTTSPLQWFEKTHAYLLKTTFSAPHELAVEEILDEIQQRAYQEGTFIDIDQLSRIYHNINREYGKDRSTPEEVRARAMQYQKQTEERNKGESPFHIACREDDLSATKYLIEKSKADVNTTNQEGATPICYAAYKGSPTLLAYLIYRDANVRGNNKKATPSFIMQALTTV